MSQFQIRLRRRDIPEGEILADLVQTAKVLGQTTITRLQYDERGSFGATTVVRRFGSWNGALEKAGLTWSSRQDISDEELFENLANVWSCLGCQPFGRHMSDRDTGSRFATSTYEKRFGSWNNALIAFERYISGNFPSDLSKELELDPKPKVRRKRTPRDVNWRLRAKILIRDNCICCMCGASPAKNPDVKLHVDHILAWTKGGETVEENLQTLCAPCNIGKSNAF